jgi:hypothetical protein
MGTSTQASPADPIAGSLVPRRYRRGDTVAIGPYNSDLVGIVVRTARSGAWADVLWIQSHQHTHASWRKRQPDASLLQPASREQDLLATIFVALEGLVAEGVMERVNT